MSTNTTNMALGKAIDADNAKTYLETTLGGALDTLDAHRHNGSTTGLPVLTLNTGTALANVGDVRVNGAAFTYRDNAGTPANHTLGALDVAQTWTALQTFSAAISATGAVTFSTNAISTTALATPGALTATQFTGFASTVSGAVLMGYGTTGDVTLKNRAGTDVLYVGPNTTNVHLAAAASQIIPGATSLSFRNNANSADNLIITDAGAATIRAGLTVSAGGVAVTGQSTIYGAGTAGIKLFTSGGLYLGSSAGPSDPGANSFTMDGALKLAGIGTTASAANAFIDNASANNVLRSTSSLRYKDVHGPLTLDEARKIVFGLRPIRYGSKAPADDPSREFVGLAAEHVAVIDDRFVTRTPNGEPDWVQYPALVAPMALVLQDYERRLTVLEHRVRRGESN